MPAPNSANQPHSDTHLRAINLGKQVNTLDGELAILEQINLTVVAGESIAIVGASGSGKSTLLGLLAGLDMPTSGRVILGGQDLNTLNEDGRAALRARLVGFVFQSFQLLPGLDAIENVMLPLELADAPSPREQAHDILKRVGLGSRLSHYPRQLSGGEQQRVAIARAFAANPRVLFADEPTGNLDQRTGGHIIELMFDLNRERNTTLILVTHDTRLAQPCDRTVELDNGRLLGESGSQDSVEHHG
jgi:putative ABC transport system ATP-binding protein